eukprot:TRINITY_DN6354_c0_g1_i1.p2 TRINITY_DN6354_c0_g1~~TRINITY_DN6354_c0_g1_i1.p2  ORF type:complete len:292 (+),score=54.75 TRINITY_DN6354_c0_g1_i1:129-878(+)
MSAAPQRTAPHAAGTEAAGHCPREAGGRPRDLPLDCSNPAIRLIHSFEGFRSEAYPDPLKGVPITIGFGTTRKKDGSPWQLGERISREEAEELFNYQIRHEYWAPLAAKLPRWGEMDSYQQGALLSFAYNLGADFYGKRGFETMTALLDAGPRRDYTAESAPPVVRAQFAKFGSEYGWSLDGGVQYSGWDLVPIAMAAYRNPGSNCERGLLRRRIAEGELWSNGGTARRSSSGQGSGPPAASASASAPY